MVAANRGVLGMAVGARLASVPEAGEGAPAGQVAVAVCPYAEVRAQPGHIPHWPAMGHRAGVVVGGVGGGLTCAFMQHVAGRAVW